MIIDRINQQASIKNARKLLKSYGTIRRLATVNTSHPLHEQAKRDLKCIQAIVGEMEDTQASIINMCYLDGSHKTRQYIADTMGYSRWLLCQESGHKSTSKFDFQFKLLNLIFGGRSFSPVQILKTL